MGVQNEGNGCPKCMGREKRWKRTIFLWERRSSDRLYGFIRSKQKQPKAGLTTGAPRNGQFKTCKTDVQNVFGCSAVRAGRSWADVQNVVWKLKNRKQLCSTGLQSLRNAEKWKTLLSTKHSKRAQNENQPSADNCAGRSYPLTAMSFFITFKSFMVKCISLCLCASVVNGCPKCKECDL